jgi:hypothetical protein
MKLDRQFKKIIYYERCRPTLVVMAIISTADQPEISQPFAFSHNSFLKQEMTTIHWPEDTTVALPQKTTPIHYRILAKFIAI